MQHLPLLRVQSNILFVPVEVKHRQRLKGEMPMRPKAPCKDCKKRHPGCHGECEAYAEFLRQHKEYYHEVSKAKGNEFYFIESCLKTKGKYEAKRRNKHK